ncbi:MAG: hypothetical protein QOH97_975 [Actinoplanes sp.]|jgi:hypothetical protein|nr:hypothetical protein [Actinoplanes sp.]
MFRTRQAVRTALAHLGPRPNWFLGTPQRATIAAVNPVGYILLIDYTNGRDWVDLPGRRQSENWTALSTSADDNRPSDEELNAVDTELTTRRLVRIEAWGVDVEGRLCASVRIIRPRSGTNPEN